MLETPCINHIWDKACGHIRDVSCETYDHWFKPIVPISLEKNVITLGVSDDFFADWITNNYEDLLSDALKKSSEEELKVVFKSGYSMDDSDLEELCVNETTINQEEMDSPSDTPEDRNDVYARNCNSRHTFSNFVVGEDNRYSHAAAKTAAEAPGIYNPLYIYGGTGMGKTHLLHAVAHRTVQLRANAIVEYVSCEEFLNHYVDSLRSKRHSEFRKRFRKVDMLLIDDVHQLANKTQLQEEFFNTFNTLYNNNKQIILTSDKQPCEIKGLEKRLVSRFESGFTTEITSPCLETRLAILKLKQEEHLIKLDDEILFFIASRISSSIRRLQGALFRLVGFSSAMGGCNITVEKAEELLSTLLEEEVAINKITVAGIQKTVADHFGIPIHDILGKKRPKVIVEPRMIAMYLSRKLTDHSFPEIGEAFGGRNHGTVMHAVKEVENRCQQNEDTKRIISALQKQIKG